MILNNTIIAIDHNLVTKTILIFTLNRINTIHTILIITDAINANLNYNSNESNHICYKSNNTGIGVYVPNRNSRTACIFTNLDKFSTNTYNIESYNKFNDEPDKIIVCYSIVNMMNNCNQYLIITNAIVINTIMYLIQTLLVESQIILKRTSLYNVYTRQTAITIIINMSSFAMAEVSNDAIIARCLVEQFAGVIDIEL